MESSTSISSAQDDAVREDLLRWRVVEGVGAAGGAILILGDFTNELVLAQAFAIDWRIREDLVGEDDGGCGGVEGYGAVANGSAGLELASVLSIDMSTSMLSSTKSRRMKTPPGPLVLCPVGVRVNPEGLIWFFLSSMIFSRSFAFLRAAVSTGGASFSPSSDSETGLNDRFQVENTGSRMLDFASLMDF